MKELLEAYIKKSGGNVQKDEPRGQSLDGSIDNPNGKKEKSKFKC